MEILITGSGGFIGKNLCNFLKYRNYSILNPSKNELDLSNSNSVKNYFKLNDPKIIFHLASVGISREENKNRELNYQNVLMVKNIVKNIPPDCRLVISGSMAEYGGSGTFRESDICNPTTEYAKSKLAITNYCLNKDNISKDIRICRIFGAYGFGELGPRLFPYLLKCSKEKTTCYLSDGKQKRDFIHVIDICICLLKIALKDKEECKKLINIGTGKAIEVKYVIKKFAESYEINPHLLKFNAVDRSPGDADLICANVDMLRSLINFVPPQRLQDYKDLKSLFNEDAYKHIDKII